MKLSIFPKSVHKFNVTKIKPQLYFALQVIRIFLKSIWKSNKGKFRTIKSIEQESILPDLKMYYKARVIKTNVLGQD